VSKTTRTCAILAAPSRLFSSLVSLSLTTFSLTPPSALAVSCCAGASGGGHTTAGVGRATDGLTFPGRETTRRAGATGSHPACFGRNRRIRNCWRRVERTALSSYAD